MKRKALSLSLRRRKIQKALESEKAGKLPPDMRVTTMERTQERSSETGAKTSKATQDCTKH
jgi:hypothetical protein